MTLIGRFTITKAPTRTLVLFATAGITFRPIRSMSSLPAPLKRPSLLSTSRSIPIALDRTFPVYNPADPDEIVGEVPLQNHEDLKEMIASSQKALSKWRDGTTAQYRANLLRKWSALIQDHRDDIATIMTMESGKPLRESTGEIQYGTSFLDYYAGEALRPTNGGFMVPTTFSHADTGAPRGQMMAVHQGVGVCGMITPWNFPIAMITRKVGPALAAGCAAIVKPSELTPLTAIALRNLAIEAGIPADVLQIITTDRENTPQVGQELCTNRNVAKLSFTGSTAVGKVLMRQGSDTMKRLSLELGGNAPFVVFDDANIDEAVMAAIASKFRNAGQTCVCADRFLIQRGVYEQFLEKLVRKARDLTVGPGMKEGVTMGPLITSQAAQSVHEKVQEVLKEEGVRCLMGGKLMDGLGPNFFEPTILADVPVDSRIWSTETFGPVAACRSFEDEAEALEIANNCRVGLASYFCTQNLTRAFSFARSLECGIVAVNDGIVSTCAAPFGGIKESGLGREGSPMGLSEYLETKYVFMNV